MMAAKCGGASDAKRSEEKRDGASVCALLAAMYAVNAVVFLAAYLVDSLPGADPETGGLGLNVASFSTETGAAAAVLGL